MDLAKEKNHTDIIHLFRQFSIGQQKSKILNLFELPNEIVIKLYEIIHEINSKMNQKEIDDFIKELLMSFL